MSELDDVQASITKLQTAAAASNKALTDIAARLTALEAAGTPPAPGVLENIATEINAVSDGLNAAATAGEATP